jgi:hypothetical protein
MRAPKTQEGLSFHQPFIQNELRFMSEWNFNNSQGWAWWFTFIILITLEAKVGGSQYKTGPEQKGETLSEK